MEAPRDISVERERLMDEFRAYGGTFTEFSHRFASWLGLHSTDATALMEITAAEEKGTPLSPARLGERISLTSGATTALLNRLEKAGHIVRTRENATGEWSRCTAVRMCRTWRTSSSGPLPCDSTP